MVTKLILYIDLQIIIRENLLKEIRKKYGVKLIKKLLSAKECIRVLRKKGNLGMLIDIKNE